MLIAVIIITAFAAATVLTGLLRRYALASSMIDVPNERSSHTVPTPRGGGMSIVVVFLSLLPILAYLQLLEFNIAVALFGAGFIVAAIGFLDDHGHIAARWRLLAHFSAAAWGLYWLGGLTSISVFGFDINHLWLLSVLAAVFLVWLLNLYNFMDGIDGLASIEAISVCLGGALIYAVSQEGTLWIGPVLLLSVVCGFLVWNFPPAKIFMGDAGSGFLGLTLGLLAVQAANKNPDLLWSWLILLGVFVVDATYTLILRVLRGEKFYEPHRSHAYQFASRKYSSHKKVSLVVLALNLLWLLPLALTVAAGYVDGALALLVAYLPLIVMAVIYKSGNTGGQKAVGHG